MSRIGLLAFSYETEPVLFGVVIFIAALVLYLAAVILFKAFSLNKKSQVVPQAAVPEAPADDNVAPGRSGELILKNVTERDAALIMAIVADEIGAPINELSFISIERKDNEI